MTLRQPYHLHLHQMDLPLRWQKNDQGVQQQIFFSLTNPFSNYLLLDERLLDLKTSTSFPCPRPPRFAGVGVTVPIKDWSCSVLHGNQLIQTTSFPLQIRLLWGLVDYHLQLSLRQDHRVFRLLRCRRSTVLYHVYIHTCIENKYKECRTTLRLHIRSPRWTGGLVLGDQSLLGVLGKQNFPGDIKYF